MSEELLTLLAVFAIILVLSLMPILLTKVIKAVDYANNFNPAIRPSWMAVDTKSGELKGGYISDKTLWRRAFWSKFREPGY